MRADAGGVDLYFEISGAAEGPAVLFSHSLATDLTMWEFLAEALAPRFRVVRMDSRGHGDSAAPAGPYGWDALMGDALAVLDAAGVERAHFVGLSMGGMLGQHLGVHHPQRFHSLTLCCTASRTPPEGRALWAERIAIATEKGMAAHVDDTLERWFTPPFRALAESAPILAHVRAMIETTPVAGYCGWGAAIAELDIADRLGEIDLPVCVVAGAGDPSTTPAINRAIADAIPGAVYREIADASHMAPLERPDAFNEAVIAFLDAVATSPTP